MKKRITKTITVAIAFVAVSFCSISISARNEQYQTIELADRNSDGYIYKGTITLTRVSSGIRETFYLFNKRGVDYVATSKSGPYYRLSRRMTINGIDYKM